MDARQADAAAARVLSACRLMVDGLCDLAAHEIAELDPDVASTFLLALLSDVLAHHPDALADIEVFAKHVMLRDG